MYLNTLILMYLPDVQKTKYLTTFLTHEFNLIRIRQVVTYVQS